jgi:hydrogenase nickel incorporation protein HypB
MGSPGSGKTTVIEGVAKHLNPEEIFVIQGDLESDIDKERLEKVGLDCYQINTHSGCHLNAQMINEALMDSILNGKRYLIVENVGNLVCPAQVKLGQHIDVVVSSTPEGSDKPIKYPLIFREASLIIVSKTDIGENVGFDEKMYLKDLYDINPDAKIVKTSIKDPNSYKEIADLFFHKWQHLTGESHKHDA